MNKSKPKPKIKAVIFDLGGVIVFGGYLDFLHHYIGRHLSAATKKRIAYLEHKVTLGSISETQFYRQLKKDFDIELTPRQMHDKIVKKMRANKSLVRYIPTIKKSKVAMFSNTLGHMAAETLKADHLNGRKVFNRVFQSNLIHLVKPTRVGYQYVTRNLGVKPHEALMVDDRSDNIAGAKRAGMHGIVFKSTAQFKRALKKYELV